MCRYNHTFCVCQCCGFSCCQFPLVAGPFLVKVVCLEFVGTSLRYPDWQAGSPHLLPVGPGAAWHSQNPEPADRLSENGERQKEQLNSLISFRINVVIKSSRA